MPALHKGDNIGVHIQLIGITKSMAGIISAMGKSSILAIRQPVAIRRKPPTDLKSAIIDGVVSGKMSFASSNSTVKTQNCGNCYYGKDGTQCAAKASL